MVRVRVSHLKKGDQVQALSGAHLGRSGKVIEVNHKRGLVKVDGIGTTKRHQKPNQQNRTGGIVEGLRWWPACKFKVTGK
jgi:large subunit ribosomal protein L24